MPGRNVIFTLSPAPSLLDTSRSMALESEPLVVSAIFLSDQSIVEQGTQKRSLIGCFDQFAFAQFPAHYPRFFITAWITNIEGTLSELDLTIRIEQKGSAHVVLSSSMKVPFGEEKRFNRDQIAAFAISVPTISFPNPGLHTIVILFNGEEIGKRDIKVLQVAAAALE